MTLVTIGQFQWFLLWQRYWRRLYLTNCLLILEANHLLHPHQGAFRCGKSTSDILLLAVDHIVNSLDCGKVVCAAFLDLRKAYDSLDHCTLLRRIGELGVAKSVLKWFQNYLTGRAHRVKLGDQFSGWRQMKGGVPQGSALGPLLFLIYMNALPLQITNGLLAQYADDTTLICSGSSVSDTACCDVFTVTIGK